MPCSLRPFVLLVLAASTALASGGDWPQWRGPGRDGVWPDAGLPDKLPARLEPRWRQPVGGGYGGVAVADGRVYLLDRQTQPRDVERVLCLDAGTGKTLWTHAYPVRYGKMDYGNGPRSTPTVRGGRVFARNDEEVVCVPLVGR